MGQDTGQIREEIEETRARMGDTVEALGYKADVPSRVTTNASPLSVSSKSESVPRHQPSMQVSGITT